MALGKNVQHLRKLAGVPRKAVARAIGLEEDQAIYAMETRDSVRSEFAPALAKYFELSLETLLTQDLTEMSGEEIEAMRRRERITAGGGARLSPIENPNTSFATPLFAEQAAELIRIFALLSPSARETVLESARAAAEVSADLPSRGARNDA